MIIDKLYNDENLESFIINGAIGDFLLFDSLLTNTIRKRIKKIVIWNPFHPINPKGFLVEKMIRSNFDYNNKTEIKVINFPKLHSGTNPETNLPFSHDFNWINNTINLIINKEKLDRNKTFIQHRLFLEATKNYSNLRHFKNTVKINEARSSYLNRKLTNSLERFAFTKEKYCVIVPHTSPERTFRAFDYGQCIKILNDVLKMKGVVLTGQKIRMHNKSIINLATKTTINESIELTKNASAYIGIDSFLSIIATEVLPECDIAIKAESFGINHPYFYNKIDNVRRIVYPHLNFERFKRFKKKNLKFTL